ncbi:zinc-finger homeodomain protein 9-like [Lotus japonicus]|uniref:zinc-finger homeodomain protein 9-like n=1 Tax=Lotus japonicus TaxID=34305 RepID=UPI00258AFF32|nr:zinc-finger homeodomain protein 9-like [Lotus japonicus]
MSQETMSDTEINFPPPGFDQEVVYKECKRNHSASLNRVSYDGCQEFLKAGVESNTKDAMLCVVCGCHQNFHVQVRLNGETNPKKEMMSVPPKRKKRTVFTPISKNRMKEFAERIGWKLTTGKKEEIDHLCLEIGISLKTFSVWLNNHRPRAIKMEKQ